MGLFVTSKGTNFTGPEKAVGSYFQVEEKSYRDPHVRSSGSSKPRLERGVGRLSLRWVRSCTYGKEGIRKEDPLRK